MTKEELLEKYKNYIKGAYIYPNGNFKVWFKSGKQVIFPNITYLEDYIEEHKEVLLWARFIYIKAKNIVKI